MDRLAPGLREKYPTFDRILKHPGYDGKAVKAEIWDALLEITELRTQLEEAQLRSIEVRALDKTDELKAENASLRHQRDLLGQTLGSLLVHIGAVTDTELTGPELLAATQNYLDYTESQEEEFQDG